ncbi:hypothetical protein IQ07DRAFT_645377 [Pyrenochaeta sp. DS3sAY3a]|nr:hypothetical protein IQ07DRAFT_645377 [Pyrenochaeta sp. DS3sAY3a]
MHFSQIISLTLFALIPCAIAAAIPDIDPTAAKALAECANKRDVDVDASESDEMQVFCPFGYEDA